MSKFSENVGNETPRLAVMFRYNERGEEEFQWGICGAMPIANLIGELAVSQIRLVHEKTFLDDCDQSAFVLVWKPESRGFDCYVHETIPTSPLCGMLEIIKHTLTGTHIAKQMAAQQVQPRVLGPDGRPYATRGIH